MTIDRRKFLHLGVAGAVAGVAPRPVTAQTPGLPDQAAATPQAKADHTIRIANGLVELAADHIVSTRLYNGQFPAPLLRLREGQPVVIDIRNDTDTPEQLHWHGQTVPVDVDGAAEEGTPYIPAHGMRRIGFTPGPGGIAVLSHASGAGRRPRPAVNIAGRSARFTSSRNASPGVTTAKSSWC